MVKLYKVRQTVTLVMETEIEASSNAEAQRLMDDGAGDFCWEAPVLPSRYSTSSILTIARVAWYTGMMIDLRQSKW